MQISKFPLWACALTLCGGMTLQAADNAAQAAARAALMQQMQPSGSSESVAPETSIPAKTTPAKTQTPAEMTSAPATAAPMTETGDTPAQAAARAKLEQELQQLNGNATTTAESATAQAKTTATTASGDTADQAAARSAVEHKLRQLGVTVQGATYGSAGGQKIVAPPPPISASKLQKLNWLNSLYDANQLSPEQYQKQRAAIMAEH